MSDATAVAVLNRCNPPPGRSGKMDLFGWAIVALIVSAVAGVLGFTGFAAGAATVARVFFGAILLAAFAVSLFV
jgi:uncharacterized membrane protein YtjA (UPF0391 family)